MHEASDVGDAPEAVLSDLLVRTLVALYHRLHQEVRDELQEVDVQALDWAPGPETNSMRTLVVHLLASAAEMLRSVRGLPFARDRSAEFVEQRTTREELLRRIDAADGDLDHLGLGISEADLRAQRVRPNKPALQSGLFWLLRNYGHAREHLAHLQRTKHLYGLARPVERS